MVNLSLSLAATLLLAVANAAWMNVKIRDILIPRADCGIAGFTQNTSAYHLEQNNTNANFANCHGACGGDNRCKSFGFGNGTCMFLDVPVSQNILRVTTSPYKFYDKECTQA